MIVPEIEEPTVRGQGATELPEGSNLEAAQSALLQSEQLLRIARRIGHMGGWVVQLGADISVSWSDEVCAIHGMPPGYSPSIDDAINFYAPEYRDVIRASVEQCISTATPFDVELQIVNAAGHRVWVRAVGEPELGRDGAVIAIRGAFQDISERMATSRALRESDQRFRLVAEATSDVFWDWNILDDRCWWSDGLQVRFGYAPGAPASQSFWSDNIHPEDRERVLASIHAAVANGAPWLEEYRFRKGDDSYALISDRALITFDDAGRACRMLGAMVDITARRTLEAHLDEAQRVASVGKLAANMAHEFNNVLMGIQPFVEVIRRATMDVPRAQDAVARIVQSLKRGKDITDDILHLTSGVDPIEKPNHVRDWLLSFATREEAVATPSSAVHSAVQSPGTSAITASPAPHPRRRLPKMVLIVDDEPLVADGISMLLASEGTLTASVSKGGEAIAAIEHHTPEVVLLDIGLPDVSGVEVFKHIYDRWPNLRVVLMTGHYSRADLSSILELPHVSFLQKPFGADELFDAIGA